MRRSECLDFCFNATLEGFRLNSLILKETNVSSQIQCVLSCVQEPCCRSVNYREILEQDETGLCEMLHDVIYNTSAELQKNCSYDHVYLLTPQKEYNGSCVDDRGDFDVDFRSVQEFILLHNDVPKMPNLTVKFWIKTLKADKMVLLFYRVNKSVDEFRLILERELIILHVQSLQMHFHLPPINDGHWHHVGASWSLGKYAIFLDGTLVYTGDGLGLGVPLKAGGVFVIGQKLESAGETPNGSFSGKLSQLNVWSEFLTVSPDDVEINSTNRRCSSNQVGNIFIWNSFKDTKSDKVVKEQPSSCKPLQKNPKYDIVTTSSQNNQYIHAVLSRKIIEAFTITTWIKCENTSMELDTEPLKFVDYTNASGTRLLSIYLTAENFNLEIHGDGHKKREARIPRFWNEFPAYWHHIGTTWSSDSGHWKIYLDGSLVSIMHGVASNMTIPAGEEISLQLNGPKHNISRSRLNIWNYEIDGHVLPLMANKGPLFENGNVFAWFGIKSKVTEDVTFKETPSDLHNSRAESVYQMDFPQATVENYVKIENAIRDNITVFSVCFWAKFLKTRSSIFLYSSHVHAREIAVFLYGNLYLDLAIKNIWSANEPTISAYDSWHFYCLQWRNNDGLIEVYQDGIKVENTTKAEGYTIPPNGTVVLGQNPNFYDGGSFERKEAFQGSLADLNLWRKFLTVNVIQGMASGVINVNGDLFQWRNFRNHVFGDVNVRNRSEAEIPGAESVYQMDFPQATVENYVKIENAIRDNITVFSLCFWAKFLKTDTSIFLYSSHAHAREIAVFLYHNLYLDLAIKNIWSANEPTISAYDSWHFYCLQWRNNDGVIEVYQDGIKVENTTKAEGYTIPANGTVVLGQNSNSHGGSFVGKEAFQGSLAGFNLWRKFLTVNVIQGMASGVINVNGDLFQWRNFRNHVFGHVNVRNRSEAEIPEYRVQILRDEWCGNNVHEAFTYARFIRSKNTDGYMWRCVTPAAMLDENMCYDITKNSTLYYTRNKKEELLGMN
ncbi:uncharacterized protein LOC114531032 isoform X2 [Dendronephthya gigantea]|nr:uncharacterized protein LOC114531032 isoform X2 [Dendronephthya gigantea]